MRISIKSSLLSFIIFIVSGYCNSQQRIVSIHPFVGDTISYTEAFDMYLFQDIVSQPFDYAVVLKKDQNYQLNFYGDSLMSFNADSIQIAKYYEHIDKLYQYTLIEKEQDIEINHDSLPITESVELKLMTPEQKKKMVKDANVYHFKKTVADEKGLMGSEREDFISKSGGYIWGGNKKKKKEKK